MKVLVAGATGALGKQLVPRLVDHTQSQRRGVEQRQELFDQDYSNLFGGERADEGRRDIA